MANVTGTTICEQCGAGLRSKDHFCEQCGAPVSKGDPFTAIAPPPPPPVHEGKSAPSRLYKLSLVVGALAVAAVLSFAGIMEYGTHSNLDYTRNVLTSTRGQLSGTRSTLGTTRTHLQNVMTTLDGTKAQLTAAQAQVQQLQQQIAGQQNTISGQQSTIASQGAEIGDLNTCLQGVSAALVDINYYNDLQAGVNELNSVDTVCTRAEKNLPPG